MPDEPGVIRGERQREEEQDERVALGDEAREAHRAGLLFVGRDLVFGLFASFARRLRREALDLAHRHEVVSGERDGLRHRALPDEEVHEAEHHADPREGEAVVEAVEVLAHGGAPDGRDARAHVDAHVEDRERAVAPGIVLAVHLADERRHVRLEEAVAGDEAREREVEDRDGLERHQEVPERHERGPDDDRRAETEELVGEEPTDERRQVDEARVPLVDARRVARLPAVVLDEIQDEQRAHAVVAESLPHLGAEEEVERPGMFAGFDGAERGDHRVAE